MNAVQMFDALRTASVALCGCDSEDLTPVAMLLSDMGCVVYHAQTIEQLDSLLAQSLLDVVVVQVCPSRQQFLPILGRPGMPPVIPLLRHADKHMYPEMLRRGAFDCVPLPAQKNELTRVLSLAIENYRKQLAVSA